MAKKRFLLCVLAALLLTGCASPKIEEAVKGATAERAIEVVIEVLMVVERTIEAGARGMIEGLELSQFTHYQPYQPTVVERTTVEREVEVTIEFLGEPVETHTMSVLFDCVGTDTVTPAAYRNSFLDPAPLPYCFESEVFDAELLRATRGIVEDSENVLLKALNLDQPELGFQDRRYRYGLWWGPQLYEVYMTREGDSWAAEPGSLTYLARAAIMGSPVTMLIRAATIPLDLFNGDYQSTLQEEAGEYTLTLVSPKKSELVVYLEETHFRSGSVPPNVDIRQFGAGTEEEELIRTVDSLLTSGELRPVATFMLHVHDNEARVVFGKVLQGAVEWDAALNEGASYIALGNTVLGQRRISIPEPDLLTKMVWGGVYRVQE